MRENATYLSHGEGGGPRQNGTPVAQLPGSETSEERSNLMMRLHDPPLESMQLGHNTQAAPEPRADREAFREEINNLREK